MDILVILMILVIQVFTQDQVGIILYSGERCNCLTDSLTLSNTKTGDLSCWCTLITNCL